MELQGRNEFKLTENWVQRRKLSAFDWLKHTRGAVANMIMDLGEKSPGWCEHLQPTLTTDLTLTRCKRDNLTFIKLKPSLSKLDFNLSWWSFNS